MKKNITPAEIFEANQVLTIEIVPTLVGKTIAVTNGEYKYNSPDVRICKVLGMETEFEAAAKVPVTTGYESLQQMWIEEGNEAAINRAKNRIVLRYEGDTPYATVEKGNACLAPGTFFGSDADREIYYIVIETKVIIKHSTKGYYQAPDKWIHSEGNAVWATQYSIEEAENIAKTLKSSDGNLLKRLELIRILPAEPKYGFRTYELVKTIENA